MSTWNDLDRTLATWLSAEAPPRAPAGLIEGVLAATRESRPLPAWRVMLSTPPMRMPSHVLIGSPALRFVRAVVVLIVLASLVAAGGLIGSGAVRLLDRDAARPDLAVGTDYVLAFDATELARWEPESLAGPGDHYLARSPNRVLPDSFIGDLTIERPDHVFELGGRESIAVPSDLVAWLSNHPSLDVLGTGTMQLDGRQAAVIDALPVFPPRDLPPDRVSIHYPPLLPTLFLDGSWRYRFVLVDLGDAGWLVATCGAPRESWAEASAACGELLATWQWVAP